MFIVRWTVAIRCQSGGAMKEKALPIRSIIILIFLLLMTATLAVLGFVVYSNWMSSTDDFIHEAQENMSREILRQVDAIASEALHVNDVHQILLLNGIVDLSDPMERERFFVGVMQNHRDGGIYSFSFGGENGTYYGARLNGDGDLEIMKNDSTTGGQSWYYNVKDDSTAGDLVIQAGAFDPRTRDWYKTAVSAGRNVFSPVYKHFVMDDLAISAASPVYRANGELVGVIGTHTLLSSIDGQLKEAVREEEGLAILAERSTGALIANSMETPNYIKNADKTITRIKLTELSNPIIEQSMAHYDATGEESFSIKGQSESYHVAVVPYQLPGMDWLLVTAIPERIFTAGVIDNFKWTLTLTVLALLISFLIYLITTRKYLLPLKDLLDTTRRLSRGELNRRVTVKRNDEFGEIGLSFNAMADTIQSMLGELEEKVAERTADLEETTRELAASRGDLRLILDSAAEAIYGLDDRGRCTFCNASCIRMLGYKEESELIGKNMHDMIHHTKKDGAPMPLHECRIFQSFQVGEGTHVEDEIFWRADGTSFDVEYYSYPQIKNGTIIGSVVTFSDITERKAAEAKILHLTYHDLLTGLYNRNFFEEELRRLDTERNLPLSVIYGDVNGLKLANDIFGHEMGDELLRRVSDTLRQVCREDDIIARVGGDEFAILLLKTGNAATQTIADRISEAFAKEQIGALRGSIAIGFAVKSSDSTSIQEILADAEGNMYREKTLHRTNANTAMLEGIVETLHRRSPKEQRHATAVRSLSEQIGKFLGLTETKLRQARDAASLHDIGKVVLDDNILNHESIYTETDRQEVRQHSMVGYRLLNSFDETLDLADLVLSHHENWDGSGYPKGLKGLEIPLVSRIIAVAERYDSLRSSRNYRGACSHEDSIEIIKREAGTSFDPAVVDAFLQVVGHGPNLMDLPQWEDRV
ncbi:MAG: sensor domain-containing diguanylate cyclase [Firmicutes bacterium HGW-Firmicutes-11]|nr:MAG: sensor domain-containing diguanylate cyclase [Firmicutes bacterium HGW-Firmicutes-11]